VVERPRQRRLPGWLVALLVLLLGTWLAWREVENRKQPLDTALLRQMALNPEWQWGLCGDSCFVADQAWKIRPFADGSSLGGEISTLPSGSICRDSDGQPMKPKEVNILAFVHGILLAASDKARPEVYLVNIPAWYSASVEPLVPFAMCDCTGVLGCYNFSSRSDFASDYHNRSGRVEYGILVVDALLFTPPSFFLMHLNCCYASISRV
jgi:hypothetical protein